VTEVLLGGFGSGGGSPTGNAGGDLTGTYPNPVLAFKGTANGLATLDASSKLTLSQIPAALVGALQYNGTWNASTNTPTLASGVGTKGAYYVCSVAGTTTLDGISAWSVRDWAVFDGVGWEIVQGGISSGDVTSALGYTPATLAANTFTGAQTINGGTITAFGPVIDATQTWNNAAISFTGIRLNVTDTASASVCMLLDLQIGGVSKVNVNKNGGATFQSVIQSNSNIYSAGDFAGVSATRLTLTTDNKALLRNSAGTDFGLLQFGGTTTSFPAIKRSGTGLAVRLADDSADAPLAASAITATSAFTASGTILFNNSIGVAAGTYFGWSGQSMFRGQTNGIKLSNIAENDFGLLQFGGTTSSFPALKRSGAALAARLADDSADATITASTQTAGDSTTNVATTAFVTSAVSTAVAGISGLFTGFGPVPYVGSTAPAGWVLASGKTIGDASSGGTERANADTSALFTLLWNTYAQSELPIQTSTGSASTRGASAAADYAAHKRMPLLDLRGRTVAGLDNIGGTTAGRITSGGSGIVGTAVGASGGTETATAPLPAHNHTIATDSAGGGGAADSILRGNDSLGVPLPTTSTGSGAGVHQNTQPTIMLYMIIKL
jgi:hypothetical protein